MHPILETGAWNLLGTLLVMLVLWALSLLWRNASIVDPFWGFGFVLIAWSSMWLHNCSAQRCWLLAILTSVWGLRLSIYLLMRNWGHGEDRRYARMRAYHGRRFGFRSLFTVFLLQGLILWFVALPIQVATASTRSSSLAALDVFGMLLWCVGMLFESVGDWQLARFKSDPANAGRILDRGLWRYTRHPNYFGDCCVWWGLYIVAIGGGAIWTIASPVLMTILLRFVSGVRMLESDLADRHAEYLDYCRRTPPFFPGWPQDRSRRYPVQTG